MPKRIKKIEVVPYDPSWPLQYEAIAERIKKALCSLCLSVHHVGSTSVPGLAAKPKIDLLVIIKGKPEEVIQKLEAAGFEYRGEWNIPLHWGFRIRGDLNGNIHVYQENNPQIELTLTFRDALRRDSGLRDQYAALKRELLKETAAHEKNHSIFPGYTLGKDAFIRKVLKAAGYNRLQFVFCTYREEWDAAKKLRQRIFFDKVPIKDPYEWTFNDPNHIHFALCLGVDIVGYAHIQLWPESRAAIRIIVVDESCRGRGFGKQFLKWIENWLIWKGMHSLHTESTPEVAPFYKEMGYTEMPFNDPDGYESNSHDIPLGKIFPRN